MKFKCIKEDCKQYDKVVDYYKISTVIKGNQTIYRNKNKKEIICKECGKQLVHIKEKGTGMPAIMVNSFNSMSNEEKKSTLVKRERNHMKKDKNFTEEKKFREDQIINKKL